MVIALSGCVCRRTRLTLTILAIAGLCGLSLVSAAQDAPKHTAEPPVYDASSLRAPVELTGPWLVRDGDNPAWADPGFDDSSWSRFDDHASIKSIYPVAQPPVLWYRLHVTGLKRQAGLALLEHQLSSAFEIYIDGKKLMQNGRVTPFVPYTFTARVLEPLPPSANTAGSMLIAVRVHISRTEWDENDPGLAAENLILGQDSALQDHLWLVSLGDNTAAWMMDLAGLCLGVVALALFASQRRQLEYLWIFLQFFASACVLPLEFYKLTHNLPAPWDLAGILANVASLIFQILMFVAFLRLRLSRTTRIIAALSVVGLIVGSSFQTLGAASISTIIAIQSPLIVLSAVVLPFYLLVTWRRGNGEAGILLIPVIFSSLSTYLNVFFFFASRIPTLQPFVYYWGRLLFNSRVGPFALSVIHLDSLLYLLSLAIIMVLRSTRMSRQQAMLESELAAAREVQQVLLPEQIDKVPGFAFECVYEPAQQVGGDFFQLVPTPADGVLLVIGDVAGKGLPAAMLVSVLVGAVRSTAAYTTDPAEMLASLNERLVGRANGSFSTALAAHVSAGGHVTIANAGHLSPYLDGQEVELPGALPLGISAGVQYTTHALQLHPGSRLAFYSDGVIEAQNAKGELFGFDRGRDLSTQPATAIAEAAKKFGQADDITVIAITRSQAAVSAA